MAAIFGPLKKNVCFYHLRLLLLECAQTAPPAQQAALHLHHVAADLVETLLLLCGPDVHKHSERKVVCCAHSTTLLHIFLKT